MFRTAVVLTEGCSWLATALLTEPWRLANEIADEPVASWQYWSWTGDPVHASNGMAIPVGRACSEGPPDADVVVLIASEHVDRAATPDLLAWLCDVGNRPLLLAGVDAGPDILARAGVLTGHAAAMHHETLPGFREQYLGVELSYGRYTIDDRRATCAGSATTLDFSLALLQRFLGPAMAARTAERLIHLPQLDDAAPEGVALSGLDDRVARAMNMIATDAATPGAVARAADAAGVSDRHLHRLFVDALGFPPTEFAQRVRMRRARTLLQETRLPITSVAIACGYGGASEFTRTFRRLNGVTPTQYRAGTRNVDS